VALLWEAWCGKAGMVLTVVSALTTGQHEGPSPERRAQTAGEAKITHPAWFPNAQSIMEPKRFTHFAVGWQLRGSDQTAGAEH
jgi:hypothetical protein